MYLDNDSRFQIFLLEPSVDPNHGDLHNICRRSLDRGIHRHPFSETSLHEIAISEQPNTDGRENYPKLELVRIALPRRVFTLSQITYVIDRLKWLYDNRGLIGGLRFVEEPKELRFYFGKLNPVSNWQRDLMMKFKEDFGESL